MEKQDKSSIELRQPSGHLYHYTTFDGLIGIVRSDSLFATHIRYMNDSKEYLDAVERLDVVSEAYEDAFRWMMGTNENVPNAMEEIMHDGLTFLVKKLGFYIISFTDDENKNVLPRPLPGDRLSQWRAYTKSGLGVSLGFDYNLLKKKRATNTWMVENSLAYLLDCVYEENEKKSILRQSGKSLLNKLVSIDTRDVPDDVMADPYGNMSRIICNPGNLNNEIKKNYVLSSFAKELMTNLTLCATTFKNPSFCEEKEWRIVLSCPQKMERNRRGTNDQYLDLHFRNGVSGITPYLEYPLNLTTQDSPLRRIVIGPNPHMDDAIRGVEMLLEEIGIVIKSEEFPEGVEVVPSRIPYRNW